MPSTRDIGWVRVGALLACGALMSAGANAQTEPEATFSLRLANALQTRLFMGAGVIAVKVKTKSGETRDVTGPVIKRSDVEALLADKSYIAGAVTGTNNPNGIAGLLTKPGLGVTQLLTIMTEGLDGKSAAETGNPADDNDRIDALGTPPGIRGEAARQSGTAGFSLGYFLGDEHTWAVEGYVLAAPLRSSVVAHGNTTYRSSGSGDALVPQTFGLEGQKIISTKLLPPFLQFGRYWGHKDQRLRLYTGLVAMYAIFYDTKASEALNAFVGGSNPGDTTVSLKNAFGVGPMLGLRYAMDDDWHVSFNLGSVRLRTQATLTTRNTMFNKQSGAIYEYGYKQQVPLPESGAYVQSVSDVIHTAETETYVKNNVIQANGGVTAIVSRAIAGLRGQETLGTYVRKTDTSLTSTMLMLNVGRRF
jgi:outer membrane protein W